MLLNMKEILEVAQKNNFAVGAYNIGNGEILKLVIEAAEENNSPAILSIHPDELEFVTDEFLGYVREVAHNTKVPVVIHLDHGANYEQVVRAIKCGFTSVMIDGSHLSFEENIKVTKEVVRLAHSVNVSVEAELGTIGDTGTSGEGGDSEIIYTDPKQAKIFVEETGVDTLAIAIGTAHGIYPKWMKPELKLDLLREIKEEVNIPLVLHGGSANPDNEIKEAVEIGICKVNISSDMKSVYFKKVIEILSENPNLYEPNAVFPQCIEAGKEVLKHKMTLFNSIGKAQLYK